MLELEPSRLADWTQGRWIGGGPVGGVERFCFDTRQLQPGDCFIALNSGIRDGHDFMAQAAEAGAVAALVSRELDCAIPQLVVEDTLLGMEAIALGIRAEFSGPVVGITGSCGKTSTKEMLRCLLGERRAHATAGNWNNRIGVPMTLFGLDAARHSFGVIEAGINQPGEMAHLGDMIAADLVVVTAIGAAHLELLGDLETIAAEKSLLMARSRPTASLIMPAELLTYSAFDAFRARAVVLVKEGAAVPEGVRGVIDYSFERGRLTLRGDYFAEAAGGVSFELASRSAGIASNAALAATAAAMLGVTSETIATRMAHWQPSDDRGRLVEAGGSVYYVDCYNANPASMADALEAFNDSVDAALPRCYVLGAMNELGLDGPRLHCEALAGHRFRDGDRVYLVGPDELIAGYCEALAGVELTVRCEAQVDAIAAEIAEFEGAIFLKGSRSYRLERVLPDAVRLGD